MRTYEAKRSTGLIFYSDINKNFEHPPSIVDDIHFCPFANVCLYTWDLCRHKS
jgi:hypothetical protein